MSQIASNVPIQSLVLLVLQALGLIQLKSVLPVLVTAHHAQPRPFVMYVLQASDWMLLGSVFHAVLTAYNAQIQALALPVK